ncbi:MAG: hypothetical protein QNJ40_26570 [Xanthomonadales bacterium]|nr:hypothetical protein [Xanthomonadales bacterium]
MRNKDYIQFFMVQDQDGRKVLVPTAPPETHGNQQPAFSTWQEWDFFGPTLASGTVH